MVLGSSPRPKIGKRARVSSDPGRAFILSLLSPGARIAEVPVWTATTRGRAA